MSEATVRDAAGCEFQGLRGLEGARAARDWLAEHGIICLAPDLGDAPGGANRDGVPIPLDDVPLVKGVLEHNRALSIGAGGGCG